jgi:hypothetical protein
MKHERIVRILLSSGSCEEADARRVTLAIFHELASPSIEMIAAGCTAASQRLLDADRHDIEEIWRAMTAASVPK